MAAFDNPVISEFTPRMGNRVTRKIGDIILKLIGWKIVGQLPREKKVIIIGAPHTSNWDLIIAMGSVLSVGLKFSWMMKKEAFFWPLGGLWKALGGIPIDRKSKNDIIGQTAEWFNANETAWLGLTPEGTRSKVEKFKKGYLRMAYEAGAPVFIIGLDAVNKHVVLDRLFALTGDLKTDNDAIKAYYDKTYKGIKPELG